MVDTTSDPRPIFSPTAPLPSRPLSPHLQVWRWTVSMASSIAQRATGIGLYAGSVLLVAWIASAAIGEGAYTTMKGILGSPLGILVLVGFTWAQMFHLCKGILHLVWDSGNLIAKDVAQRMTLIVFVASVVLTVAIWGAAMMVKG